MSDPEVIKKLDVSSPLDVNIKKSPALFAGLKYSDFLVEMLKLTVIANNRKDFKTWNEILMNYFSMTSQFMGNREKLFEEMVAISDVISTWSGSPNPVLSKNMFNRLMKVQIELVRESSECLMKSGANDTGDIDFTMASRGA
jgi:hypothetical protein